MTTLTVLLLVPLLWSFALYRCAPVVPNEAGERRRLLAMVLPSLWGLLLLCFELPPDIVPAWSEWSGLEAETVSVGVGASIRAPARPLPSLTTVALMVYAVGVSFGLAALLRRESRLHALIRETRAGTFEGQPVWLTDAPTTPFASHGRVVLPSLSLGRLATEHLRLIVAHERRHLERRDPHYLRALSLFSVLAWPNPFVWLQARRCRIAMELAVDADVLRDHPGRAGTYARALIETLRDASDVAYAGARSMTHGEHMLRIRNILRPAAERVTWRLGVWVLGPLVVVAQIGVASATAKVTFEDIPLEGRVTSHFGTFSKLRGPGKHTGVDIAAAWGTPIVAPADGVVVELTKSDRGYGNRLTLDHGQDVLTRYAHVLDFAVEKGEQVTAGQLIARVGSTGRSTGPHLHFEILEDGKRVDPIPRLPLAKP